jgi:hypothetical protein
MLKDENLLFKKFDSVLIITPSQEEFKSLFLPQENFTDTLDWDWIKDKVMLEQKKVAEWRSKNFNNNQVLDAGYYINMLIIFDDMLMDLHKNPR